MQIYKVSFFLLVSCKHSFEQLLSCVQLKHPLSSEADWKVDGKMG